MATRLYFTNSAAGFTPTSFRGTWNTTASAITKALGSAPAGTAATIGVAEAVATNPYNVCLGRWVSGVVAQSGILSGQVSWALGMLESNSLASHFLHVHIYVTVGASSTVRGTLLSDFASTTQNPTTATAVSSLDQAITSLAVTAGDLIVVEVGYKKTGTSSTSRTSTMNYGNTGTFDISGGSTSVTTQPGWIQFSDPNHVIAGPLATGARNLAHNPSAGSGSGGGWTAGANVSGTAGTVSGMSRTTGVNFTVGAGSNGDALTVAPSSPASAGETWVVYGQFSCSATRNTTVYLDFTDANGAFLSAPAGFAVTLSTTPQQVAFSGAVAPANTAAVDISQESAAGGFTVGDIISMSCIMYDQASAALTAYSDGDSSAWTWDGTAELSTSHALPDVIIIGDSPSGQRSSGPSGTGIDVAPLSDGPTAQRLSGSIGTFIEDVVLIDTPSAQRLGGPTGTLIIDLTITDGPAGLHFGTPDGLVGEGVSIDSDSPTATYSFGLDGLLEIDLTITDRPRGARHAGGDGLVTVGLTIDGDGPSAERAGGPVGTDFEDANPSVNVTDTPGSERYTGPTGSVAISVIIVGDTPLGARHGGLDGIIAIDVLFTDAPNGGRYGGPDGDTLVIVGGTDTPNASRSAGADGLLGIVVPITGDAPGDGRYGGPLGALVIGVGADVIAGSDPPSGARLSGSDGQVLLAIISARQPYVAPAPFVTPGYALWVADTRTGKMLWELPMTTSSWTQTLNDVGTIRTTLAIEQVYDSLTDQNERDPRVLLREILTGPWRFTLVLKWGNNVVWAGPYVSMNRTSPTSLSLGGVEIGKMLSKRIMVKPGAVSAIDPTADLVIGPYATKPHAAYAIINQMLTGTNNNLPFILSDPAGAGQDSRTYYGYDLADYWSKLQALSAEVDGPEVRFDPQISAHADGDYLSWFVQIGSPYVGQNATTWMFDSDVTSVVGFDGDGSSMSFGVYAAGNGTSVDKLVSHAFSGQLLNIGWPMLESVDTTHSSETVYPVLTAYANAGLSAHSNPISSFQVQVPADVDPMVGTYHVGETFTIDVRDDPIIPDGTYTRRIAGITGTEKPWVTLTDTNATLVSA